MSEVYGLIPPTRHFNILLFLGYVKISMSFFKYIPLVRTFFFSKLSKNSRSIGTTREKAQKDSA